MSETLSHIYLNEVSNRKGTPLCFKNKSGLKNLDLLKNRFWVVSEPRRKAFSQHHELHRLIKTDIKGLREVKIYLEISKRLGGLHKWKTGCVQDLK